MHIPVLAKEVIEIFNPRQGQTYLDGTVGEGGHSSLILEKINPNGILIGIDWDEKALLSAKSILSPFEIHNKVILVNDNYANLRNITEKYSLGELNGLLLDLGFGTHTLENLNRGFSFKKDERLDMRYNLEFSGLTAEEIVNNWSKDDLIKIFREYGEERFSGKIAEEICRVRKDNWISTTGELVGIIAQVVPRGSLNGRIHFATRIFQALRIAVNHELDNLKKGLTDGLVLLQPQGKLIVISFHSLEDRIVKNFFKEQAKEEKLEIITLKPVRAGREELKINPKARSAKLRAIQKL